MTAFIGSYGRLVGFQCPSAQPVRFGDRSSYMVTMGGKVVEQRGPAPRRVWDVRVGAHQPDALAGLETLFLGSSSGHWFLPPDALAVNMLTPLVSVVDLSRVGPAVLAGQPVTVGGVVVPSMMVVPAGERSFLSERENGTYFGTPVEPGWLLTVSGVGRSGFVELIFRDLAGAYVRTDRLNFGASLERRHVFVTVPEGAVDLLLRLNGGTSEALHFGAPQISFGHHLMPWGVGRAAHQVSVDGWGYDVTHAVPGSYLNYAETSFTVTEVG